ncbi:hypothetical protein ABZZ79_03230 [Streptomyces sp. NPDC006458]|uniref:hypothetical protein n=1 Tax=Streptomyces sp. NPDC006458 TaxID=3154302 RepID=UPI0033A7A902
MMDEPLFVVCSPTARHTAEWRREMGLPRRRVMHAGSVSKVDGVHNFVAVYLPGFHERRDAAQIRTVLDRCLMKLAASRAVAGS